MPPDVNFLRLKCTKIKIKTKMLRPRPRWGSLQRSPRPSSWIKGGLLLREGEGIWEGRGKGGGDREGREGKGGRGVEGTEREGTPNILLHPSSSYLEICLLWNSLPLSVRDPSLTMTKFCTHLTTSLFRRAYCT